MEEGAGEGPGGGWGLPPGVTGGLASSGGLGHGPELPWDRLVWCETWHGENYLVRPHLVRL